MSYRPLMDGKDATNLYDVHEFSAQISFGASTAMTFLGKDVVVTRPTSTTIVVAFPQPYVRVVKGSQLWQKPTGADPVGLQITTNNLAVDGTVTFTSVSLNSAGVATAPASGDVCWLTVGVSDHDANQQYSG